MTVTQLVPFQAENLSVAYLEVIVHPQHRRRGIGTRLLEEVYAAARRLHRSLIEIETVRALPGGVARDEAGDRYLTNRGVVARWINAASS